MKPTTLNSYIQSINRASHYIATHLDEMIDVKTLARVANLSDFHFCRIFKAIKGEPPIAFIARLRIETAAQLLRYSSLAVEEIAYNIGYESPASLSKAFKNRYGITPTQYRTDKNIYIMKREVMYQGPYENLAAVYDEAMRWLVNSEYELRDEPMFEKYLNNCQRTAAEKLKTEVYIPIR